MTTICIMGTMYNEIEQYIKLFDLKKVSDILYIKENRDERLIAVCCGIGKVNSSSISQYVIDKYNVDIFIIVGYANKLKSTLKDNDIVLSLHATYYDVEPIEIMESYYPNKGKIESSNILLNLCKKIIIDNNISDCYFAPICSGDSLIQDHNKKMQVLLKTGSYCVDMESASIAHISSLNNISYISIKTIYGNKSNLNKSGLIVNKLISELYSYLKKNSVNQSNIYFSIPKYNELDYYKKLLSDPKTMSYNAGYDLNLDGYDKESGCIYSVDVERWYKKQCNDKNRYFAYVINKENNNPVGYVNFHFDNEKLKHSCGIVIEYKYRNKGYGDEALKILLSVAFKEYKLNSLINTIPYNRTTSLKLFMRNGFKDIKEEYYMKKFDKNERVITLELNNDDYLNN